MDLLLLVKKVAAGTELFLNFTTKFWMCMKKLLFVAIVALSFSCSKDEDKKTIVSNEDYFPNTTGSTWTYDGPLEATMTVTGEMKAFDGKTYSELMSEGAQSGESYLYKNKGEYILRGFAGATGIDLLVLKDNVSEGTQWEQHIKFDGGTNHFTYTLAQKNVPLQVGDNTFNDVIKVQLHQSTTAFGFDVEVADMNFFFARGVGIVRIDTEYDPITGYDAFNGTTEVVSYTIE